MSAEYGCYVKKKTGGPTCRLCSVQLKYGDGFARIYINSYADPYFHAKCLDLAAVKAGLEKANLKEYAKRKAEEDATKAEDRAATKVKSVERKKKTSFQKQILRDALKTQNILVSKVSITGGGHYSESRLWIGPGEKLRQQEGLQNPEAAYRDRWPDISCDFIDQDIAMGARQTWSGSGWIYDGGTKVSLADPDSLQKIGEELVKRASKWIYLFEKKPKAKK